MFSLFTIILLTANDLFKCRSHLEWNRFNIVRKFNCARNLYTGCRCLIDYLSVGLSMNWSFVKIIVLFEGINTRINRPKYEYESFIFCFSIRQVRIYFIIRHTILFFLSLVPHLQQLKIHCRNICRTKWESEVIAWNVVMAKGVIWKQPVRKLSPGESLFLRCL